MRTVTDHERYQHLQARMLGLLKLSLHDSDSFQRAWGELEMIKNRHGGKAPEPDPVLVRVSWPTLPKLQRLELPLRRRADPIDSTNQNAVQESREAE